jgi:hypothetical protein
MANVLAQDINSVAVTDRVARLDDLRDAALRRKIHEQERQESKSASKFIGKTVIKARDLVLLRRLAQDNQHSHKLEPWWLSPYLVKKISSNKKSAILKELHSDAVKGKYHINNLKPFIQRSDYKVANED